MTDRTGRRGWMVGAALAAAVMAAGAAAAQEGATKHDAASDNAVIGAGAGSGGGSPNTVVDPSNGGVAGTGMGKMPMKGDASGTGQSVKGPAGQGISNSTDTAQ